MFGVSYESVAVEEEVERALVLDQRAAEAEAEVADLLRARVGVNGLRPLSEPPRIRMPVLQRIGPRPGCVMISMNVPPAAWFSAAN